MFPRLFRRLRHHRQIQPPSDRLRNIAKRNPPSATPWYRAPAAPFSSASRYSVPASSRCTAVHRFFPSPTYADTPFSRAILIKVGTKPWSPSPCTDGESRTTDTRTPRSASAVPTCSDARGNVVGSGAGISSVASVPGRIIAVPDVTSRGRSDPASTSPSVSIARLSTSHTSFNLAKSWMNPQ